MVFPKIYYLVLLSLRMGEQLQSKAGHSSPHPHQCAGSVLSQLQVKVQCFVL